MNHLRKVFNNGLTLLLLLAIGAGVVWFFSHSQAEPEQLVVQQPKATPPGKKPTPTTEQKPTLTPMVEAQVSATPTLHPLTPPDDDSPEPTWTPGIIISQETPPPLPTPFPTPTPTPINPDEKELVTLDVRAFIGSASPNGQDLAFIVRSIGNIDNPNPHSQLWKLDLVSKQSLKLTEVGANPIWSPDSQRLAYDISTFDTMEVKSIKADGTAEQSLFKNEDLLGYYWIDVEKVGLLRSTGIDEVDLNGQVKQIKSLNFPVKDPANFDARPKLKGHSNVAVVMLDRQLLVTQPSGQTVTIISEPDSYIYDFALSPNGQQIAYLVTNDSFVELWVSHFNGQNQHQLFVVEDKHLIFMAWSPDSQTIIVGWSYPGTNVTGELTPVWINTKNGQIISLGIDQINVGLTFSADGSSLYYGRSTFYDDFGSEQGQDSTTFYELEVK